MPKNPYGSYMVYEPKWGETFDMTAAEALSLATEHRCPVRFDFNGRKITAQPGQDVQDLRDIHDLPDPGASGPASVKPLEIEAGWGADLRKEVIPDALKMANAYRQPVRLDVLGIHVMIYRGQTVDEVDESWKEACRLQDKRTGHEKTLQGVLKSRDPDRIVDWVEEYVKLADRGEGLSRKSMDAVRGLFEKAGYSAGAYGGDKSSLYDRGKATLYIVGQLMGCLEKGVPPRQNSFDRLIGMYRKEHPPVPIPPSTGGRGGQPATPGVH
ncbi:MAG: hypothetical protein M3O22_06370 [Pseudomonadota bacterium]|nr:hypothetical protein [Pseudomonadota bacterium]